MERFIDAAAQVECVQLNHLPPLTTLLVWTRNSFYRIMVREGASVWVQGGSFFTDPTPVEIAGASTVYGFVLDECICIGLKIDLRVRGTRILTSPVLAITTESADVTVH